MGWHRSFLERSCPNLVVVNFEHLQHWSDHLNKGWDSSRRLWARFLHLVFKYFPIPKTSQDECHYSHMSPKLQVQPPSSSLPSLRSLNTYTSYRIATCVDLIQTIYYPELGQSIGSEGARLGGGGHGDDSGYASDASHAGGSGYRNTSFTSTADELRADAFERSTAISWLTGLIGRGEEWVDSGPVEVVERRSQVIEDASTLLAAFANSSSKPSTKSIVFKPRSRQRGEEDKDCDTICIHLQDAASTFLTQDHTSVGLRTWGASQVLAERLVESPESFGLTMMTGNNPSSSRSHPLRILELGAGTGLISLVLAKLSRPGTAEIFASDYHPQVLENLKTNVSRNFGEDKDDDGYTAPRVISLDWRELHDRQQHARSTTEQPALSSPFDVPFDIIFGADVIYEPAHALWIKSTVQQLLRRPESASPLPSDVTASGNNAPSGPFLQRTAAFFNLIMAVRPTHTEETYSVPALFPTKDAVLSERGKARGDKETETKGYEAVLAIDEDMEVVGMGETGRDEDAVRYLIYRIGWI
ncbi:hypothetical protein FRB94_014803 [Tulasnella sp. JGI-2019a]|nr:hypothetical protein FRB93_010619 [Tulasnella sp. JGI-2019a]KAG8988940.1 hypothetical protein FRB94_014803 [Tulasnella sp. JGI-2019a]KAG9025267.1 hypothetical protein FRB95_010366 [Tulasnella sp. JGI-2019a]